MSQRGQNRTNGPTTINVRGEESHPSGGTDSLASRSENRQPGEGDPLWGGTVQSNSRLGHLNRSPMSSALPRLSSGYQSLDYDSPPTSPLMTHNKSTQTPSPSSQLIVHAKQRISQVQDNLQDYEMVRDPVRPFRALSPPMPADMRPEVAVADELRRIGDEFQDLYMHGGVRGGNGWAAPPQLWHGPIFLLWITDLVGRLLHFLRRR